MSARSRQLVKRWGALAVVGMMASGCFDSTPETPQNALMDFITAAQVGDDQEAEDRVCDRLADASADPDELAQVDRVVYEASVFGFPGAVLALGVPDSRFGCEIADLPGIGPSSGGGGQLL